MINGIPYFKEYNNEIRETILNSKITYKTHTDIYSLVNSDDCINNKLVVVIDNKWLTYLSDIQFNYRDINCRIPYFTYELYEMGYNGRSNNKGHLIVDIGKHTTYIRYNYTLQNIQISIGTQLEIYNLRTQEKVLITITDWTNSNTFKLHVLHNLYLKSSYIDDSVLTTEFKKGYHYISKCPKEFINMEYKLRNKIGLSHYNISCQIYSDYRDVRQYKYMELVRKIGEKAITTDMLANTENYRTRRLRFESYLYCSLRKGLIPSDIDSNDWASLQNNKQYIKVVYDNIPLIIKQYWLDNHRPVKYKTYSRLGGYQDEIKSNRKTKR